MCVYRYNYYGHCQHQKRCIMFKIGIKFKIIISVEFNNNIKYFQGLFLVNQAPHFLFVFRST
jgi:hypothetical protein